MATPPLRHHFYDESAPTPNELPAAEYNLNAVRTDMAYDLAVTATADVDGGDPYTTGPNIIDGGTP